MMTDEITEVSPSDETTLLEIANVLLRHRRLVVGLPLGLCLIVGVALSFAPRTWSAGASFMPQAPSGSSGRLAGLAAQLGVGMADQNAAGSPAFYVDLLTARSVLQAVARSRFTFPSDTGVISGSLIDLLEVTGSTEPVRIDKAVRQLKARVATSLQTKTGVVSFSVKLGNPVLSKQVAQSFLDQISRFNLEQRQSQAGAERRFAEGRLEELQRELRAAEDRLQDFVQKNRDFRNSPQLTFEQDRLARDVALRQQIYVSEAGAYEQARIDEVRDTPVITVIERPEIPVRPDPRGRLKRGLLALIVGGFLVIGWAFWKDYTARQRLANSPAFEEFRTLRSATLEDLRRMWSRFLSTSGRRVGTQAGGSGTRAGG